MSPLRNLVCLSTLLLVALLCGCEAANDGAPDGRVSGAVVYRERMALPPNATIIVRLLEVTQADAPAELLAEQIVAPSGRQVPIPFELRYSSERVDPGHSYAVRAEIRDADGRLLFATTEHHAVITAGAPTEGVDVLVQRVGAGSPQAVIDRAPCIDGMSGEAFDAAATVTLDGKTPDRVRTLSLSPVSAARRRNRAAAVSVRRRALAPCRPRA